MERWRALAVGLLALSLIGCASAPGPTPATVVPTAAATPVPSPTAPEPTSTDAAPTPGFVVPPYDPPAPPAALPGVPFDIGWRPIQARAIPLDLDPASGVGFWYYSGLRSLRWGGSAFVSYMTYAEEGPDRGPMLWRSSDLVEWHRVLFPAPEGQQVDVRELAVGGPGVVALGVGPRQEPLLWVSTDGEAWETVGDLPDIRFLWARPGVIVGFGSETWLSTDGRAWFPAGPSPLAALDEYERGHALAVDDGDSAIVFTRRAVEAPTVVYRLTPHGAWQRLAELDAVVAHAVRGPDGIVAIGSSFSDYAAHAWRSRDGVTWESATGPAEAANLLLTRAGYVATSQRIYYRGCDGFNPAEQIVQTWTSHDGLDWRLMEEDVRLDHTELPLVFPEGDRLVAIGIAWSGSFAGDDTPRGVRVAFEAAVPTPIPSHTPLPVGAGCGED